MSPGVGNAPTLHWKTATPPGGFTNRTGLPNHSENYKPEEKKEPTRQYINGRLNHAWRDPNKPTPQVQVDPNEGAGQFGSERRRPALFECKNSRRSAEYPAASFLFRNIFTCYFAACALGFGYSPPVCRQFARSPKLGPQADPQQHRKESPQGPPVPEMSMRAFHTTHFPATEIRGQLTVRHGNWGDE